MNIIPKKGFIA